MANHIAQGYTTLRQRPLPRRECWSWRWFPCITMGIEPADYPVPSEPTSDSVSQLLPASVCSQLSKSDRQYLCLAPAKSSDAAAGESGSQQAVLHCRQHGFLHAQIQSEENICRSIQPLAFYVLSVQRERRAPYQMTGQVAASWARPGEHQCPQAWRPTSWVCLLCHPWELCGCCEGALEGRGPAMGALAGQNLP